VIKVGLTTASLGLLTAGMIGALVAVKISAAQPSTSSPDIVRIDSSTPTIGDEKYPPENSPEALKDPKIGVLAGQKSYDGWYKEATRYLSKDKKYSVGIWESGPGVLKVNDYPQDEYCLIITGDLVITNASGSRQEFHPGDTFVIPKGWVGTWEMKSRLKKQEVDFDEQPK
jgi:uncharacterized cupin superfamily protein